MLCSMLGLEFLGVVVYYMFTLVELKGGLML